MLTLKAAALKYEKEGDKIPTVIAKGKGLVAEKIIAKASEVGVPLFKNALLADSLLNVEIDREIPPALYKAVVEVFVWLAKNEDSARAKKLIQ
jgi:flagellar biosynthesis protein